jgi:hypothetical protein
MKRGCFAVLQEHLVLRGWQDNGSYFQLKASTALQPDLLSLFEVEQLLLAPGTWSPTCCSLFGLTLGGCQVRSHEEWWRASAVCSAMCGYGRWPNVQGTPVPCKCFAT